MVPRCVESVLPDPPSRFGRAWQTVLELGFNRQDGMF